MAPSASSTSAGPARSEMAIAGKLADPNTSTEVKLKIASEIRENVDNLARDAVGPFAEHILPAVLSILDHGPISLLPHTADHKLRFTLLDLLHRLPFTDAMRPFLPALHALLLKLIKQDSEEVALLAVKTVMDIYRSFDKEQLEPHAQSCLETIKECFASMASVVADTFDAETEGKGPTQPDAAPVTPGPQAPQPLPVGLRSFKVLAECPIVIVFLFQSYRDLVAVETQAFVPIIFDFLQLQPAAQGRARREAEARGELFTDVCVELQSRRDEFSSLLLAQVKAISFAAYTFRVGGGAFAPYRNAIPDIVIRMLKDFPTESTANRKELLVALRHVLASEFRNSFIPYTDTLLDERVLIGQGITAHEHLRQIAYGMIADYVHHIRADLTMAQLSKVVHAHGCIMHDLSLPFTIHSMCSKLLLNLVGSVLNKNVDEASEMLHRVMEITVRKVESLAIVRSEWERWMRPKEYRDTPEGRVRKPPSNEPPKSEPLDDIDIERQRPIGAIYAMAEPEPDSIKDVKALFKNLLVTVRSCIATLKHMRAELPGAAVIARMFIAGIRCFGMVELGAKPTKESRAELKEIFDAFSDLFTQVDLLTFNAIWEMKIYVSDNYYDVGQDVKGKSVLEVFLIESMRGNGELYVIPQTLLSNKEYSHAFSGILLKYLVSRLPELGSGDKEESGAIIRLFKMAFMSVSVFPEANETVLLPHLSEIITSCLKFSSESPEPMPYFLLLRALFRAIGGGRFEQLYKAVLPLLQLVLEHLNTLLETSDRVKKDLFVELCLTVPVRLSVLLPYLSYLMKPLVLALESSTELVAQGLRTLELCIDNLTAEFLNPLMAPVIDDVFAALWKLLRPVPAGNPHYSHQTLRILGKLGGKNRKITDHSKLKWRSVEEEAKMLVRFEGKEQAIKMVPVVELAVRVLKRGDIHYREVSFNFLKYAATTFLERPASTSLQEETFSLVLRGLMESVKAPELASEATEYILGLTNYIFESELGREMPDGGFAKHFLPRSSVLLDAMTENLALASNDSLEDLRRATDQTKDILLGLLKSTRLDQDRAVPILRQFSSRLSTLCYDHLWHRKAGGACGMHVIASQLGLGPSTEWLQGHELEMVRALLFLVKDAPLDPPPPVRRAVDTLVYICENTRISLDEEGDPIPPQASFLVGLLVIELSSQVSLVRETAKQCIQVIADRRGISVAALLAPVRERLLAPIFAKPLRALAFSMQIGHIDAVTYCISLDPPLLEFDSAQKGPPPDGTSQMADGSMSDGPGTPGQSQESQVAQAGQTPTMTAAMLSASQASLVPGQQMLTVEGMLGRLLVEALGIADADDVALANKQDQHKSSLLLVELRVVCVKFLSAALSTQEYNQPRQGLMRSKIMQVYFKLLHRPEKEIVDATYQSLKLVVQQQGKLPKDQLQSGLRPVLTNLADWRKLDVASLEGLARLLELLTNYFKVEIGSKILDHFRAISSDVGVITRAEISPQDENSPLKVLSSIVNIFHLLPQPASAAYLPELCAQVVNTEKTLKKVGPTRFTKPLALFLNNYPQAAAELFLMRLVDDIAWCRTFMAVLSSGHAEALRHYVQDNAPACFMPLFGNDQRPPPTEDEAPRQPWRAAYHGALVLLNLVRIDSSWLKAHSVLLGALVQRWVSPERKMRLASQNEIHLEQVAEDEAVLEIYLVYLRLEDHVDMLFHCVEVFTVATPNDHLPLLRHLYLNVITSDDVRFKRRVLDRFLDIFCNTAVSETHKAVVLKHIINPLLLVHFSRLPQEDSLLDTDYIALLHLRLWQPYLDEKWVQTRVTTEPLRVELMYMTKLIIRYQSSLITDNRKDVIKFGWSHTKSHEALVLYSAYSVIAQFLFEYESPAKIVLLAYTTLLKAHSTEAKALVREGLATLAPALPVKGVFSDPAQNQAQNWIKTTRSLLADDGQGSLAQISHVYQFVVRQPQLFYPRRDIFTHHILANLSRFSTWQAANSESRTLSVDLFALLLEWEQMRLKAMKEEKAKVVPMDVDAIDSPTRATSIAPSSASGSTQASWQMAPAARDQVVTFLLKTTLQFGDPQHRVSGHQRALDILQSLLSPDLWPDVGIKLSIFQVPLMRTEIKTVKDENTVPLFIIGLQCLAVLVQSKSQEWTFANIPALMKLIERSINSVEPALHEAAAPVLRALFRIAKPVTIVTPDKTAPEEGGPEEQSSPMVVADPNVDEASKHLFEWAINSIDEGLRTATNLHSTMCIVQCLSEARPEAVDSFAAPLVRVVTRLTKEHLSNALPDEVAEQHQKLLETALSILKSRVLAMGDQRRWLLSALVQLVEKSNSRSMCKFLLDLLTSWVFDDRSTAYPTIKEKAGLLAKMLSFEGRHDDGLLKDFLCVILRIYGDPSFVRSELTVRLEQAFLLGCRSRDAALRCEFLQLFDRSISKSLFTRLHYLIGVQSWESLADAVWLHQALDLLLGAIDADVPLFEAATDAQRAHPFAAKVLSTQLSGQMVYHAKKICYAEPATTAVMWPSVFAACWACLGRREQNDITRFTVSLLSKDYNLRCIDRRPNNVQILLHGLEACDNPKPVLPPHLLRYLGRTYNVWYTALEMLQDAVESSDTDPTLHSSPDTGTNLIQESSLDALAELYSDLCEEDLFYGLWRRRSFYPETNIAISFEQNGMWVQAQQMYEAAQVKARTGAMPFTESEYAVWEDQWVTCAMKLQQWDILGDLARHEGNPDLSLECSWRLDDWYAERDNVSQTINSLPPVSTPRRRVFEALTQLIKSSIANGGQEAANKDTFVKICTNGTELALRKWFTLPEKVGPSHIPVLHTFQQFVELNEAGSVFQVLSNTTQSNYEARMSEVKAVLMAWRERLPNEWDDINIWSDLVAWRQHVFAAINRTLLPLLPPPAQQTQGGQAAQANTGTVAYRGYHETAWTVNRFAHVARKHQLMEVCISALNKIYTLPNIEIQEAFLKLREQAKSHYYHPGGAELTQGLDVINNTNLVYFGTTQKAEFFCLKGMFLSKLGIREEASAVFNQAVTLDMHFAKGWAEWGEFHDRLFRETPTDLNLATNAVSCYLQAAGLFKNHKTRKLLIRILWLLSLDDANATVAKAFDAYKGDVPIWYWITFIPQLLQSLSHREAKIAKVILLKISRLYPQSLFFHLRTHKVEMDATKKVYMKSRAERAARLRQESGPQESGPQDSQGDIDMTASGSQSAMSTMGQSVSGTPATIEQQQQAMLMMMANGQPPTPGVQGAVRTNPWDFVEEIHSSMKTGYPLMSLTLETMAEQIVQRFKPSYEEEMHRILYHLIHDGMMVVLQKTDKNDSDAVPDANLLHMKRFCDNINNEALRAQFSRDFVEERPNLSDFFARLQKWRSHFRNILDGRGKTQMLESCSHWLVEFLYHRFDDVEVPGQYIQLEDNPSNFVRIAYFNHKFDFQRFAASTARRLTIVGQDGSSHTFVVQSPSPKHGRREERIIQLLRLLNSPLQSWKESRKRNLTFYAPTVVPLATSHRLIATDGSVTSLQDIFEEHCGRAGMAPEDPVLAWSRAMRKINVLRTDKMTEAELEAARLEIFNEITVKIFPDDILKKYMARAMATASDLWHARKQMTLDLAAFILTTFILFMGSRSPLRIQIAKSTGALYTTDPLPSLIASMPEIRHTEPVPFRFTPNLQKFVSAVGTEGRLTTAILAMARGLLETDNDLEHRLSIFIKEEVIAWHHLHQKSPGGDALRDHTLTNIDTIVKRTKLLACSLEREKQPVGAVPANQSILELIAQATNPIKLAATDITQLPWL